MQLKLLLALLIALVGFGFASTLATAQALSPMHNTGKTPSDVKGFKLTVGNPYPRKMTFQIVPMDTKFVHKAADAEVSKSEITLAPNAQRIVIVTFKINPPAKERTIGVCVLPKNLEGLVQPRVCGTYTGVRLSAGG